MTQEKCERAVKALQENGFKASHVMGAPDDHGVWLNGVWTDKLGDACSFRIHDEEIEWWQAQIPIDFRDLMKQKLKSLQDIINDELTDL